MANPEFAVNGNEQTNTEWSLCLLHAAYTHNEDIFQYSDGALKIGVARECYTGGVLHRQLWFQGRRIVGYYETTPSCHAVTLRQFGVQTVKETTVRIQSTKSHSLSIKETKND